MTCPKCTGLMATYHNDPHCLNCGYREGDLNREIGREGWGEEEAPSLCRECRVQPRAPRRTCCASCLYQTSARMREKRAAASDDP